MEVIHIGHDNSVDRLLLSSKENELTLEPVDLGSATFQVDLDGTTIIDSTTEPTALYSEQRTVKYDGIWQTQWVLVIKPGLAAGVVAGEYSAKIIVYDSQYTNGIVWGVIPLRIVD